MLIVEWWKDKHALPLCNALCGHAAASPVFGPDNKPRCAICGAADADRMHHRRWRDCCPDAQLQWSACERTRTRSIPPRIRNPVKYGSLEELLSDAAMGDGRNFDLQSGHLRPSQRPARKDASAFMVWRSPARGGTVSGGSITLPESGILLLHGRGARFCRVTFTGGVVMCAGADCSATFQSCNFIDCSLYAVNDASVTLGPCAFNNSRPAVLCSGAGTVAHLRVCYFNGCPTGIVATRGASVTAERCRFRGVGSAVVVSGAGSHAEMTAADMRGGKSTIDGVVGVAVHNGMACMHACTAAGLITWVRASGRRARVEIHDSYCQGCDFPINLGRGTSTTLREVDVRALQDQATHADSHSAAVRVGQALNEGPQAGQAFMQAERCMVKHLSGRALCASHGSRLSLHLCNLHSHAVAVDAKSAGAVLSYCHAASVEFACTVVAGSMRACSCQLEGGRAALLALDLARVSCVDTHCHCSVPGANLCVVGASDSAVVHLLRCHVFSGVVGVRVMHAVCVTVATVVSGISAVLSPDYVPGGTPCASTPAQPAYECLSGMLRMSGGAVRNCDAGVAVHCDTDGAVPGTARVTGVVFEQLVHSGLAAMKGCWADMADCTILGKYAGADADLRQLQAEVAACRREPSGTAAMCAAAVRFCDARGGSVRRCHFEGNVAEVFGAVRERLEVEGCTFVRHLNEEAVLVMDERTVVRGCTTKRPQAHVRTSHGR